ncbi:MAG: MFS transporter [Campylobacteraceae bacterium]|jgi:MFS family permease|nr:MFS transporter [Campylobacteraceae bacterium]MBT3882184.1 MFS transporter [Campylobacteraceae bacterium]MBT4030156.1 MFS transporter [Campylobacteraceae bacterium]MBT4179047.1 MFS transporter [Campylobacteraceae bacterium]MBT4572569.1 MFS transporter [Campylobacteraceae bacterium]
MTYSQLFKKEKVVRQLSLVQLIAYFGAWFSNVAIFSMLVEFGASSFTISLVTAMLFLPAIIISPFSGTLIDRLPLKKLMVTLLSIELIMTIMFLFIGSIDDIWLLCIILFIRMGSASMFFSTEMTLLPKVISGEALQKANEIHSIIWSFTYTSGMAVSGIVVALWGTDVAFIIDAFFFILALIIFIPIKLDIPVANHTNKFIEMLKDGFIYTKNSPIIIKMIFLHATVGLTSFDAIITLLADWEYKTVIAVPLAIGISNAVRALALMIGPFVVGNIINKNNLGIFFILQGIFIIIWGLTQYNFYISLVSLFLVGFLTSTIWSYTYALLQEQTKAEYLGRVLAYNEMIFMLTNVLTALFIGVFASILGLNIVTFILGGLFFVCALWYKKYF